MSEKAKPKAKAKAKPKAKAEPVHIEAPEPAKTQPATNHTIKDICKIGREYKASVAALQYVKGRERINRAAAEDVEKAEKKAADMLQSAEAMHQEYMAQPGVDKKFAKDHLKALRNVKA